MSSYYYLCVLIPLLVRARFPDAQVVMCPHTIRYVSSYYYICVFILRHMCPHTHIQYTQIGEMAKLLLHSGHFGTQCTLAQVLKKKKPKKTNKF
jgi:hypothetical protein